MDTEVWAKSLKLASGDQVGDFLVSGYLGNGGTAAVYTGKHVGRNDDQVVALKILNPTILDLRKEERRLQQQLTLSGHNCPYLIQPLQWFHSTVESQSGEQWDTLIDVSEYVKGSPLDPVSLREDRIRPILSMVVEAARYLDARGLCHRDIKPDNIIVTPDERQAILLDLGVLHAYQPSQDDSRLTGTDTNHALVTRRYSSPEILRGQLGSYSDQRAWLAHTIYQLGAIICEAITRGRIFERKTGDALVTAIAQDDPFAERPVIRCQELEATARACLSKEPQDRLRVTWEDLACRRRARKPTVVLLYCGGTIGAATDPRGKTLEPRRLGKDSLLPRKISERLILDFQELALGSPMPAVEWRFVDKDIQVFSENSSPDVWNGICRTVSDILEEDWSASYLLGLVLLHGTDTLAYTASALQLAFPSLPCPLVVTGSNQPPSDDQDVEQAWYTSRSDAWQNLFRSVQFLVDGGHRLPMVYVAFANTICHAVNVQKTPLNRIPLRYAAAFRFMAEAFGYRNVEIGRRFAYKYVEGVLVNSFLPILEQTAYEGPPPGSPAPWERTDLDVTAVRPLGEFSKRIVTVDVSPCVHTDVAHDGSHQLVVAYPSGTVSEVVRRRLDVPNTIVTQWGLSPHQAEYAAKADLPETGSKLFRLVPETALPLVSLALSDNDGDVEARISSLAAQNPLVRALIGNPLDRERQRHRAEFLHTRAAELHNRTLLDTLFRTERRSAPAALATEPARSPTANPLVTFRPHHFDALLYGLVGAHGHAGSLAEQYGAICDIGFDTGVSLALEESRREDPPNEENTFDSLMRTLSLAIVASGLAKIKTEPRISQALVSLRMAVKLPSPPPKFYSDSWALASSADHDFLQQLEEGIPLELPDSTGDTYFTEGLRELHAHRRTINTSPTLWYLIGIVKGALCWYLSDRSTDPLRSAGSLRPKVKLRLFPGRQGASTNHAELLFARSLFDVAIKPSPSRDELPSGPGDDIT